MVYLNMLSKQILAYRVVKALQKHKAKLEKGKLGNKACMVKQYFKNKLGSPIVPRNKTATRKATIF